MVLGYIARRTGEGYPVYQRDIEEQFHIRRSSVTTLLKAMEEDGFIKRTAVSRDARLKSLALTEKGDALCCRLFACIDGFEAALHAGLSAAEIESMHNTLNVLFQNANSLASEPYSLP